MPCLLLLIIHVCCVFGFTAHRQTQRGRSREPDLGRAEFPPNEQALHRHAPDRGADGLRRGVEPIAAGDGRVRHARPARGTQFPRGGARTGEAQPVLGGHRLCRRRRGVRRVWEFGGVGGQDGAAGHVRRDGDMGSGELCERAEGPWQGADLRAIRTVVIFTRYS